MVIVKVIFEREPNNLWQVRFAYNTRQKIDRAIRNYLEELKVFYPLAKIKEHHETK